jgi:hypothetical protein
MDATTKSINLFYTEHLRNLCSLVAAFVSLSKCNVSKSIIVFPLKMHEFLGAIICPTVVVEFYVYLKIRHKIVAKFVDLEQ